MSQYLVSNAGERLSEARQKLSELHRGLDAALAAARRFNDPDLTAQGNTNKRADLEQAAREKYLPMITELAEGVAADVATVRARVEELRPQTPADAVGLQRLQQKWDQVRIRLDAGMSIPRIIQAADEQTLLAIAEWSGPWLEAQQYAAASGDQKLLGYKNQDNSWIQGAVDARLAELAGGDFAYALAGMVEAEQVAANVAPIVGDLQSQASGGPSDPFAAAIAGHVAADFVAGDYALGGASGDQEADYRKQRD